MGRLIFIDATMREESRTRRIAGPLVSELAKRYEIETISLDGVGFPAVDYFPPPSFFSMEMISSLVPIRSFCMAI